MPLIKSAQGLAKDYQLLFFISALFLYGAFSSPTPDNPGVIELLILSLMLCAIGFQGGYKILHDIFCFQSHAKWKFANISLLLYGLSVPIIVSLFHDVSFMVLIRDVVAFLFLTLPLFLTHFILKDKNRSQLFFIVLLFIGLAFSIRVLFLDFSFFSKREELLYLANSPLVLFSALYFAAHAIYLAIYKIGYMVSYKNFIAALACSFLAMIPMAAMFIDFQRASFLALGVMVITLFGMAFIKAPLRAMLPLLALMVFGLLFSSQIVLIIENIALKTSQVGLNMRHQEFIAVWEHMTQSPWSLIFGHGWGAHFASPAVGGLNVPYTHSLLTYMLLKTGLIGLGLTLIYLFFIFEKAARLVFIEPAKGSSSKGNSLIWPFVIPILLYASYKSLDYGLILTLIVITEAQTREALR